MLACRMFGCDMYFETGGVYDFCIEFLSCSYTLHLNYYSNHNLILCISII